MKMCDLVVCGCIAHVLGSIMCRVVTRKSKPLFALEIRADLSTAACCLFRLRPVLFEKDNGLILSPVR